MRKRFLVVASIGLGGALPVQVAFAQVGIIVQNPTSYAQKALQFSQQIANLTSQLAQMKAMVSSVSGTGSFGNLAPGMFSELQRFLPDNWQNVYDDAMSAGSSLAGSASNLQRTFSNKLVGMTPIQKLQYTMQQMQSKGAYDRAMVENTYNQAAQQLNEIKSLNAQINGASTQKQISDLQARIQTAQGSIQAQSARLQLMNMLQQAQTKMVESQRSEAVLDYAVGSDPTKARFPNIFK